MIMAIVSDLTQGEIEDDSRKSIDDELTLANARPELATDDGEGQTEEGERSSSRQTICQSLPHSTYPFSLAWGRSSLPAWRK